MSALSGMFPRHHFCTLPKGMERKGCDAISNQGSTNDSFSQAR